MKAREFSEAQTAFILKQDEEGTPVAAICRKAGISHAACFAWSKEDQMTGRGLFSRRTKYAGLLPDEMRRLTQLKDENARLKTILADRTLDRGCCRMSSAESPEAWSQAWTRSWQVARLGGPDPAGLWGHRIRPLDVSLHVPPHHQAAFRIDCRQPGCPHRPNDCRRVS